uniref:MFS-type transporter SLC18B1 (inferred by orthology to a human protein) n=1 Tax=Strongyloides venezuelensis TaxID=75913 RepID=A0A0K0FTP5_STRVS
MKSTEIKVSSFRNFTLRQWIIFWIIILSNIVIPMTFSCISSFFNDIASSKNVSLTSAGIVFAVFSFGGFISSPIAGKLIPIVGVRVMFSSGMVLLSIGTLLFSLTNFIENGTWFFIATLCLRILQSMGNAMSFTTTYAIAAKDFPNLMSTILGSVETGVGIGYTVGPFIGGYLYQYVSFASSFLILGTVAAISSVIAFFSITSNDSDLKSKSTDNNEDNEENKNHLTWVEMIKIKDIWCILLTAFIVGLISSFHDATLAVGCKQFNLDPSKIGILFLYFGGLYALCAPIIGFITDKYQITNTLFVCGYIISIIAFLCMGPAPFLNYKTSVTLFSICLTVMGFSCSMLFVPSFKKSMDIVIKENNYADSLETSSIVSAAFSSSFSFGAFLGPFVGSALVEKLGYRNALSVVALISFIALITFIVVYLLPRIIKKFTHKQVYSVKF